jgi:hypothetical protein
MSGFFGEEGPIGLGMETEFWLKDVGIIPTDLIAAINGLKEERLEVLSFE